MDWCGLAIHSAKCTSQIMPIVKAFMQPPPPNNAAHESLSNNTFFICSVITWKNIAISRIKTLVTRPFEGDPLCKHITINFAETGSFKERALASFPGKSFQVVLPSIFKDT